MRNGGLPLHCRAVWLGMSAVWLSIQPARADVIYTYSGLNFDTISDSSPPTGSYNTTMSVSGFFALANPLAPNFPVSDITANVLNFSFFDGRNTLTPLNVVFEDFRVATNSLGLWSIDVATVADLRTLLLGQQAWSISTTSGVFDLGRINQCDLS